MKPWKRVFRIDNVIKSIPVSSERCRFNEEPLQAKTWKDIIRKYTGNQNVPITDPHDHGPLIFVQYSSLPQKVKTRVAQ